MEMGKNMLKYGKEYLRMSGWEIFSLFRNIAIFSNP